MIREAILRWARARQPDFIIGGQDAPYLRRLMDRAARRVDERQADMFQGTQP